MCVSLTPCLHATCTVYTLSCLAVSLGCTQTLPCWRLGVVHPPLLGVGGRRHTHSPLQMAGTHVPYDMGWGGSSVNVIHQSPSALLCLFLSPNMSLELSSLGMWYGHYGDVITSVACVYPSTGNVTYLCDIFRMFIRTSS